MAKAQMRDKENEKEEKRKNGDWPVASPLVVVVVLVWSNSERDDCGASNRFTTNAVTMCVYMVSKMQGGVRVCVCAKQRERNIN